MTNLYVESGSGGGGGGGGTPPSVVQGVVNGCVSGSLTSQSRAFNFAVTAGNTLIGAVSWYAATGTIISVHDSLNSPNWTLVGSVQQGNGETAALYCYHNTLGGTCTVTVTISVAQPYLEIAITEVSHLSGLIDASTGSTTAAVAGPVNAGPLTTTTPNDYLVAYCATGSGCTAGQVGWTFTELSTSGDGFQWIIGTSPGTFNANFTLISSSTNALVMAAFKPG
jgi:hypothetical protein